MERVIKRVLVLLTLIPLVSCGIAEPELSPAANTAELIKREISALREYRVDSIGIDYIVECKARIKTIEETYSGNCQIILTRNLEFKLTISSPLGGTIMQIYADKNIIQVNNVSKESFYEKRNTPENRSGIPILEEMTLEELQAVLWGRITRSAENSISFSFSENKPLNALKQTRINQVDIRFKRWLTYEEAEFPKLIDINEQNGGLFVRLVVTNFTPGYVSDILLR